MFCPKCGKQVDESDAFCRSCGDTLSKEKSASTGVAPASGGARTVGVGKAVEPTKRSGEATAIIRVVALLFALGFIISERDWIRDAADNMGGYDDALKLVQADAVKASNAALTDVSVISDRWHDYIMQAKTAKEMKKRQTEVEVYSIAKKGREQVKALEDARRGAGGDKAAEPGAEPTEAVQARGYKDDDGMYRARREDDAETQRQFDLINEDLIVYVPMCGSADSALKIELDKSLRLDEYELSRLVGLDEAKAFHKRVADQGCF